MAKTKIAIWLIFIICQHFIFVNHLAIISAVLPKSIDNVDLMSYNMITDVKKGAEFMKKIKKGQAMYESLPDLEIHYESFGERLRAIRKERGMTQDEFAAILGTSKQILSRYELEQRSPKIEQVKKYAEKLQVSVDYLLGDTESEAIFNGICSDKNRKPFYKIFIEVTTKMGLDIPAIVRVTGLTDRQVRMIIVRQMKDAPLPIALQLSKTLNVPLEVWAGDKSYAPSEISVTAYEVAKAYDNASLKDRNTARLALNLETVKE